MAPKSMENLKTEGPKWITPIVGIIVAVVNIAIAIIIVPLINDVKAHSSKLATMEERLRIEPEIHELISERQRSWTREQIGIALTAIQTDLREIRKEIQDARDLVKIQP